MHSRRAACHLRDSTTEMLPPWVRGRRRCRLFGPSKGDVSHSKVTWTWTWTWTWTCTCTSCTCMYMYMLHVHVHGHVHVMLCMLTIVMGACATRYGRSHLPSRIWQVRDSWWSEIREEVRAHARSLGCSAILGYHEYTSYRKPAPSKTITMQPHQPR